MRHTSGVDVLLIVFQALTDDEQDQALRALTESRTRALVGEASEGDRFLDALRRVAAAADGELTPDA